MGQFFPNPFIKSRSLYLSGAGCQIPPHALGGMHDHRRDIMLTHKVTAAFAATAIATLGLSFTACAQDTTIVEPVPATDNNVFNAADINTNGQLDREEFVAFAVMKADEGDADFAEVRENGTYDDKFNAHDANADGALTPDEVAPKAAPESETSDWDMKGEETDTMEEEAEPEMN